MDVPAGHTDALASDPTWTSRTEEPGVGDAGKEIRYEYISSWWCQSQTGVGQANWVADADTGILDEEIMNYYDGEEQMNNLLSGFSLIAIIIGSLGLYGLISFMVIHKAKEVGIRKALGANSFSIIKLLSMEFLKLLIVGFIISLFPNFI